MREIQDLRLSAQDLKQEPEAFELVRANLELFKRTAVWAAREDPASYAEYVFQQKQQPYHDTLQQLLTAHRYLCIDAPVEHGKTTQVDIVRPTWEIGRNQSHMIALLSNSSVIPVRAMRIVRDTLENNDRYHEVFPQVEVTKSTTEEIWVKRKGLTLKDPTMVGMGILGAVIGSRISILILDDILDFFNTYSENERAKLWDILTSTILNRVLANGRVWDIGTPWHVEDGRHKLRRLPGYVYAHFDAEDGQTYRLNEQVTPILGAVPGTGLWSETYVDPETGHVFGFPPERLEEKRQSLPAHEFQRQFKCVALSGALEIFSREALDLCRSIGRETYNAAKWVHRQLTPRITVTQRDQEDPRDVVFTGVDLAARKKDTGHLTAFYTGSPKGGRREVLEICAGYMEQPEIAQQVIRILRRYPNHRGFRVEDNGAQAYLLQLLRNDALMRAMGATDAELQRINVIDHTTTSRNKWEPIMGIRGMTLYFEQGRWPIPNDQYGRAPGLVQQWYDALVAIDPKTHTNDLIIASWLFSEQCRSMGDGASGQWARHGVLVPQMEE